MAAIYYHERDDPVIKLSIAEMTVLGVKEYANEVKGRLRSDREWVTMLDDTIIERTRSCLIRIVTSIDAQKKRIALRNEPTDTNWVNSANKLQNLAQARLDEMPVERESMGPTSKEARAWRAFSARLAVVLHDRDPEALDGLEAPYGGMTARQWLSARNAKAAVQ